MSKIWTLLAAAALCLTFSAGCARTADIYNPTSPVEVNLTHKEMHDAIYRGMMTRGWTGKDISNNVIRATLNLRTHQAVVDITYDQKSYSIKYVSSQNLLAEGDGKIHRSYNKWVRNLDHDLRIAINDANMYKNSISPK